ncbi:RDD family protein [Clostridium neuense]|uniref:RDD family protein n=1 Tax=Clostridium neuense TaxID=1728934 RepID=A0ABW8TJ43_9CLOT
MYCPTCGSENPEGAKVCEKCGASLTEDNNIGNSTISDEYEVEYAGLFKRFLAYVVDGIILAIIGAIVGKIVGYSSFTAMLNAATGKAIDVNAFRTYYTIVLIIGIAYYVLLESSPKQGSLGKMLLGIKITNENGGRISIVTALERYVILGVFGIISSVLSIIQGPPKVSTTGVGAAAFSSSTILAFVSLVYYIIILITMLSSQYKQGLHDKLAKTYVVSK